MADYALPPWLQFDPAQRLNSAIASGRASRDRERQLTDSEGDTQFEEGRESTQDANTAQDRAERSKANAAFLADMTAYQSDLAAGVPPAQAVLKHPIAFSGRLPAAAFAPPKPAVTPGFSPLTQPGAAPPALPQAAPASNPDLGGEAPPPVAPPAVPPTNPQWLQPPGIFTDATGRQHFERGTPIPATHPLNTKPGDILVDPSTQKPFFTNTTQKAFQPLRDPELNGLIKERELAYANLLKTPANRTDADKNQPHSDAVEAYKVANDAVNNYKKKPAASASSKEGSQGDVLKAGTKVKNADGKVKYIKTDGTLPDGWTVAQ